MLDFFAHPAQAGLQNLLSLLLWLAGKRDHNKEQRDLAYMIVHGPLLSQSPLLPPGAFRDDIEVFLHGVPAGPLEMCFVEVRNGQGADIARSDWDKPFRVDFGEGAHVVGTSDLSNDPEEVPIELRMDDRSVWLQPTLLNRGDVIRFWVVVENLTEEPVARARVLGVRALREIHIEAPRSMPRYLLGGIAFYTLASATVLAVVIWPHLDFPFVGPPLAAGVLMGAMFVIGLFALVRLVLDIQLDRIRRRIKRARELQELHRKPASKS